MTKTLSPAKRVALGFLFLWFLIGGIGHFVATDFFARIVPPYVPMSPRNTVLVSGVFELLGAFALLIPKLRAAAGWALIALILCVSPANVYMWQHAASFPDIPAILLGIPRLLLQIVLIACAWWSTRTSK